MSRDGLLKTFDRIGFPQRLLKIAQSFHADMKGIGYGDSYSTGFQHTPLCKQGCVLAPTFFGIFAVMLKCEFGASPETEAVQFRFRSQPRQSP